MRLAVVGGGAMGGTVAAEAAHAGQDVTVLDVSEDLVARIRANGITVDGPDGRVTVHVGAETSAERIGEVDCAVVFVKAQHTTAAARSLQPLVGSHTAVVTLQNGWGNADLLAESVPPGQLVMGVTYHSCTVVGPAHLAHTGRGPTYLGPYLPEGSLDAAQTAAGALDAAGWPAEVTAGVRTEIWKKLVLNAATLPTAALTRLPAGDAGQPGPLLDLVEALAAEAVAVARAQGLGVDIDERLERIRTVLAGAGKGKASMLQDVEGQRKTEVETVNGAVTRIGDEYGVSVPLNRAMVALIGGLERGWAL